MCYQGVSLYESCNRVIISNSHFSLWGAIYTIIFTACSSSCTGCRNNTTDPLIIAGSSLSWPKPFTPASSTPFVGKYWPHWIKVFLAKKNCVVLNQHLPSFNYLFFFMKLSRSFFCVVVCLFFLFTKNQLCHSWPYLSIFKQFLKSNRKGESPHRSDNLSVAFVLIIFFYFLKTVTFKNKNV